MDTQSLQSLMLPGDLLTYSPVGIAGFLIRLKCWHNTAHCEVYVGNGQSVASRDGIGVGQYPVRLEQLNCISRPKLPFNISVAMDWFKTVDGEKYDWIGLLCFTTFVDTGSQNKMFCSEFVTRFYRRGGFDPISKYEDADKVAPFELEESPVFDRIYASPDVLSSDKGV